MTDASGKSTRSWRWLRRCFQFRLMTLLVVIGVIGVCLGLWSNRSRKQQAAVAKVRELGGWVYYDFQGYDPRKGCIDPKAESSVPKWLGAWLPIDFVHDVVMVNMTFCDDKGYRETNPRETDEALTQLESFPRLRGLYLQGGHASDEGLRHVGRLRRLECLVIWRATGVTDVGVAHLANVHSLTSLAIMKGGQFGDGSLKVAAKLPRLRRLCVYENCISDQGLAYLVGNTSITSLNVNVSKARITDAGMKYVATMTQLDDLWLQRSEVTQQGLAQLKGLTNLKTIWLDENLSKEPGELKRALPKCKFYY
jgi:hypothetical protein